MLRLVVLAFISGVLFGLSYGFHTIAIPFLLSEVNTPIWQFGLAESISMTLASLALIKTLRVESKKLARASAIALFVSRLSLVFSTNPFQALTGYTMTYVASSLYRLVVISAILDSVKKYKATSLGALNSVSFVASTVSPILGAFMLESVGSRGVLLVNALLALTYLPLAVEFSRKPEKITVGIGELYRSYRPAFLFVLLTALGGFPGSMYMVFENIIGVYIGKFPSWVVGAYTSLESALITIVAPLTGLITDKCRKRYAVLIANDALNIPYAFAVIYGAMTKNPFLFLAAPIPDALMSATSTASRAVLKDLKAPTRQILALSDALGNLSAILGALIAGFMLDLAGAPTTLLAIMLTSIAIVLIDFVLLPKLYARATGEY